MPHGMSGKIRGGQGVTQGAALKRVLVIKHGALGDMVQGFDAFAGLRAGLPYTHLALLTTPPFFDLGLNRNNFGFSEHYSPMLF